jgi:AcrR family transcriptional regulator
MQPGRRERRRAEIRERLLTTAFGLIAERGLENTRVEDITEAADVGKGTFFNYFPTKEHVLGAFAERQIGKYAAALERVRDGNEPVASPIRWLYFALPESITTTPALARGLMRVFLSSDVMRRFASTRLEQARHTLATALKWGQQRGELRQDVDAELMAFWFQQSLFGSVFLWTVSGDKPLKPWLEKSFKQYWSAVAAPKGSRNSKKERAS